MLFFQTLEIEAGQQRVAIDDIKRVALDIWPDEFERTARPQRFRLTRDGHRWLAPGPGFYLVGQVSSGAMDRANPPAP